MRAHTNTEGWLKQLDDAIAEFRRTHDADKAFDAWVKARAESEPSDDYGRRLERTRRSAPPERPAEAKSAQWSDWTRCYTVLYSAVGRVAPGSRYEQQCRDVLQQSERGPQILAELMLGITEALRFDVAAGYLTSFGEEIHGDLFTDFLEMARHLLDDGFKDAAAVIAGSALEEHLRQMCRKANIATEAADSGRPKKAEAMNVELVKADAYRMLDQKNVTAWLDLRNKAAHARYGEYEIGQVRLLIDGIRDFVNRHPA